MEHSIYSMKFRRKFSVNPYKTLRLKLAEMSFFKDWLHTDRGDPYPVTLSAACVPEETVGGGRYTAECCSETPAETARLIGQHFPYAAYEVGIADLSDGGVGFRISAQPGDGSSYTAEDAPVLAVWLSREGDTISVCRELTVGGAAQGMVTEKTDCPWVPGMRFQLLTRGRFFDIYLNTDRMPVHVLTFELTEFRHICRHGTFVNAQASLYVRLNPGGKAVVDTVESFLDGGVSHADIKPIRYEDGTPMMTEGRLFLTMSSRLEAGGFQSVISWNPSCCDFRMEGAIFFDCGDDIWCADVASSVLYNRMTRQWYIWACSFSHGHILCHGVSAADLRYGINVIDACLMPAETVKSTAQDPLSANAGTGDTFRAALSDDTLWLAKSGDEDPDFVYDKETGKWNMIICRCVTEEGKTNYRYFLFESEEPFSGYRYVDRTMSGANTGGSIVKVGRRRHLICGSNFHVRAQYDIYDIDDLSKYKPIRCDWDDGGFRGWGTVIPVPCGSRIRYMWITFDRHGGSSYNWSYGNLYVYESDLMNAIDEV